MKIERHSIEILFNPDWIQMQKNIEYCGRVCYQSRHKITDYSYDRFIRNIVKNKHFSVLEHEKITVKFITDLANSHRIVRHRHASFSQESTRFNNYKELTFIEDSPEVGQRLSNYYQAIEDNFAEIAENYGVYFAKRLLPKSLKTEIIVTANLRSWREILEKRTTKDNDFTTVELFAKLRNEFAEKMPAVFSDMTEKKL